MRLIYLSPVPWTSFFQRPHKFVQWFHERYGQEVLWIDPYPTRLPKFSDFRRLNMKSLCCNKKPDWLTVLKPWALPIEPLLGSGYLHKLLWHNLFHILDEFVAAGNCQIGIGKPSKLALQILERMPGCISFYDAMDKFSAVYEGLSRRSMEKNERVLIKTVTKILVSSRALQKFLKEYNSKVILVRNACSIDCLPPIPWFNKKQILQPPIIGYIGTIAHWFDWSLVCNIARQNPLMKVRLIGPIYTTLPSNLPKNIEIFPQCDHEAAIKAMHDFSLGLIPFKQNELTASVDPIKYYEYIAIGLPVISTSFGEMAYRNELPGVFIIKEGLDLKKQVETALAYEAEPNALQAFRDANSWKRRFDSSGFLS